MSAKGEEEAEKGGEKAPEEAEDKVDTRLVWLQSRVQTAFKHIKANTLTTAFDTENNKCVVARQCDDAYG